MKKKPRHTHTTLETNIAEDIWHPAMFRIAKKKPTSSVLICHVSFVPLGLHRVMNNMVPKTLCIYFQPENKPVAIHTFIHNKTKREKKEKNEQLLVFHSGA